MMLGFPWRKRTQGSPEVLEDYFVTHPDLQLLVRSVLAEQVRGQMNAESMRDLIGRVDELEGNPNSTTGGSVTGDIFKLQRRLDVLEEIRDRETVRQEVRAEGNHG